MTPPAPAPARHAPLAPRRAPPIPPPWGARRRLLARASRPPVAARAPCAPRAPPSAGHEAEQRVAARPRVTYLDERPPAEQCADVKHQDQRHERDDTFRVCLFRELLFRRPLFDDDVALLAAWQPGTSTRTRSWQPGMCGVPGTSVLFPSCPAPFPHHDTTRGPPRRSGRAVLRCISTSKYVCVACVAWCAGWHPAVWGPTPQPERWRCRPHARGSRGWPKGHAAQHARHTHDRAGAGGAARRGGPERPARHRHGPQPQGARTYVPPRFILASLSLQPCRVRASCCSSACVCARGCCTKENKGRARREVDSRKGEGRPATAALAFSWEVAGRGVRACVGACVRLRAAPRRAGPRRAHAAARAGARR